MKDNTKVFEDYSVPKAVCTMALPSMLSMLINIVYNLADTFFVGQTGDSNQVAAVSVSMPLFLLFIAMGNLFGVGGCAFISRSLGEGKKDRVKTISAFCILLIDTLIVGSETPHELASLLEVIPSFSINAKIISCWPE
jgi:multidrug efflux pump